MNQVTTSTTTVTNATNGAIYRITTVHHVDEYHQLKVILAVLAFALIATGVYLLTTKRKKK